MPENLVDPIKCSLRFIILDNFRKTVHFSSLKKKPFFFKNLCFQQYSNCYRNDLIISTITVKIPFGPSQNIPWGLSHSKIREKKAKSFVSGKIAFFWKVWFSTFLGPKNWSLSGLHNTSQITFWNLIKLLHDICHARYYEKK